VTLTRGALRDPGLRCGTASRFEQSGSNRAEYGEELLKRLVDDLTGPFGRGFSKRNLEQMRPLYRSFSIAQTVGKPPGTGLRQTREEKRRWDAANRP